MIARANLVGWVVFARFQENENGDGALIPYGVIRALLREGFAQWGDVEGERRLIFTELANRESDLAAEEWGIEHDFGGE